jgi:hypothetical protein
MDGVTDAVSIHVVGIGMDRAVGIEAVIVTVEIAAAVTVARVIAVAVIVAKHVSGRMAAAVVVANAMENGGHAVIDLPARKHKGVAARVRDGGMEVGVMATAATAIVLRVVVATATAVMGIGVISTAPREIAATGIVRRAGALTATVQTAAVVTAIAVTSIVTPIVEVTSLARRPPNRLKAFGRMTRAIVSQTLLCRWPAVRVMLA